MFGMYTASRYRAVKTFSQYLDGVEFGPKFTFFLGRGSSQYFHVRSSPRWRHRHNSSHIIMASPGLPTNLDMVDYTKYMHGDDVGDNAGGKPNTEPMIIVWRYRMRGSFA